MIVRAAAKVAEYLVQATLHYQSIHCWYRRRRAPGRRDIKPEALAGAVAGCWEHRHREWSENDRATWAELQARCVRLADAIVTRAYALPHEVWTRVRPEDCRLLALLLWASLRSIGSGLTLEEIVSEVPRGRTTITRQLARLRSAGWLVKLQTRAAPARNDRTVWMATLRLRDTWKSGRRRALQFPRNMVVPPRWDRGLALLLAGRDVGASEAGCSRATWYRWRAAWIAEGYARVDARGRLVAGERLRRDDSGEARRAIEQRAWRIQREKSQGRAPVSRQLWRLRMNPQTGSSPILTHTSDFPLGRRPLGGVQGGKAARRALTRPRGLAIQCARRILGPGPRPPSEAWLELKREMEQQWARIVIANSTSRSGEPAPSSPEPGSEP